MHSQPHARFRLPEILPLALLLVLGSCGEPARPVRGSFRISLVRVAQADLSSAALATNQLALPGFRRLTAHPGTAAKSQPQSFWVADEELLGPGDLREAEVHRDQPAILTREQFEESMRQPGARAGDATNLTYEAYRQSHSTAGVSIYLVFTEAGAQRFAEVTRKHIGRQLAIVVDDQVIMAPTVRDEITAGTAQISGDFDAVQAQAIVDRIYGRP